MNGHSSGVVWFTGLPGSGKTTLADESAKRLLDQGIRCVVIDGDRLRNGLNRDLGFAEEHRIEHLRRAAEVAAMFVEAGFLVLAPLITPSEAGRAIVRKRFVTQEYVELYVKCSLAECESRDPKGMYQLARSGSISSFTGITAPYEPPLHPDLVLDTEQTHLDACVEALIKHIRARLISDEKEKFI